MDTSADESATPAAAKRKSRVVTSDDEGESDAPIRQTPKSAAVAPLKTPPSAAAKGGRKASSAVRRRKIDDEASDESEVLACGSCTVA